MNLILKSFIYGAGAVLFQFHSRIGAYIKGSGLSMLIGNRSGNCNHRGIVCTARQRRDRKFNIRIVRRDCLRDQRTQP